MKFGFVLGWFGIVTEEELTTKLAIQDKRIDKTENSIASIKHDITSINNQMNKILLSQCEEIAVEIFISHMLTIKIRNENYIPMKLGAVKGGAVINTSIEILNTIATQYAADKKILAKEKIEIINTLQELASAIKNDLQKIDILKSTPYLTTLHGSLDDTLKSINELAAKVVQ